MRRPPNLDRDDIFPIPPLSVVRLAAAGRQTPTWKRNIGKTFRIGYYSKQDGLDCIWLVNNLGKYEQTTDHDFLYKYFDIISLADHKNWHGHRRPKLQPILPAKLRSPKAHAV